jgi:hypothetical protein
MPSRTLLSAVPSYSSSVYSADDVSETNTTGTQIRHISALSATVHDNEHDRTEQSSIPTGRPSQDIVSNQLMSGAEEIGPRPSTPPRRRRRRRRITSTGSISVGTNRDTVGSLSSVAPLSLLLDRGLLHTSIDVPTSDHTKKSKVVSPKYSISEDVKMSASPSDPPVDRDGSAHETDQASQVDSRRNQNRAIVLEVLLGRANDTMVVITKSGNLVSATGCLYRLGDSSAGYYNRQFVTDLQRSSPSNEEQKRRAEEALLLLLVC